jgi:RNA polymerase sigma factor (sigma-70 family)
VAAVQSIPRVGRLAEPPAAEVAARLYEAYQKRVFRYCLACLRSREEAEDAAQSTFLYAFKALERGITPEAEVAWLLAIARNVCMARHRTRGRRRERETLQDPVLLQDVSAAPERSDGLAGIEDALASLPETQRRAILLREWRGFSYREIAEELGLSGAAVETLIFRARKSLAEQLDGERAHERRRALRGLDIGSAAAALKSLFGGGAAAKLAVAAATAVAVATVAGEAIRAEPPTVPPSTVRQVVPAADLSEHVVLAAKAAASSRVRTEPRGKAGSQRGAEQAPDPTPKGASDPVTTAAETVVGAVDQGVPELPGTSLPSLPELPVELPPVPELAPPDLPLP